MPEWRAQLEGATPPALGRCLSVPDKSLERLRLIVERGMQGEEAAVKMKRVRGGTAIGTGFRV